MYRKNQNIYMLYPNRELHKFLEKNIIPEDDVKKSSILKQVLKEKQTRIIEKNVFGCYHFNGRFRNSEEIRNTILELGRYDYCEIQMIDDLLFNLIYTL